MGVLLLVGRLALRDLRRRRAEAVLLLLAILAATTTLTLGLVLRDAAGDPYRNTREATHGPDVVAWTGPRDLGQDGPAGLARLDGLAAAAGVTGHSGPFPVARARLATPGGTSDVQVIGRDSAPTGVDQPKVLHGSWVSDGGVVLEAAFADALHVRVGDPVTLGGRSLPVVGVAATASMPHYPGYTCLVAGGCGRGEAKNMPAGVLLKPGLVWLTRADLGGLGADSVAYVTYLKLTDPDRAPAFAAGYDAAGIGIQSWHNIRDDSAELARDSQILLLIGAWLLGLLAVASLSVLVGGRMADQTRRVGLLKAVGGRPGLIAAVLLAEYLLVALAAAAAGLAIGTLTAPLLTESSAGLLGSAGPPPLTPSTIGLVTAVALGVAALATLIPAVRAARISTVRALADAPRPPRRVGWLIAISARLPVPLLLALRVAARRPRRAVLSVAGIAVTVSGIYVLLILDGYLTSSPLASSRYVPAQLEVLRHVLGVWTVILLSLAAVNAVVVTWATALDNRHQSALVRALGAGPGEVTVALAAAQVLPALAGALLGVFPVGYGLFHAILAITGGDSSRATLPSPGQLLGVVLATVLVVAALTAVPARLGSRRPVTESL